jgi:hypothetical protein
MKVVFIAVGTWLGLCSTATTVCAQLTLDDYLRKRLPTITGEADSGPASQPRWLPEGGRSAEIPVDVATGLVLPKYPFSQPLEKLPPDDPQTKAYTQALQEYYSNRERILQARNEFRMFQANLGGLADEDSVYVASRVAAWNGEIFWAPASKEADYIGATGRITRAGDEIRAVFGSIPPFDVSTLTPTAPQVLPDGSTYECRTLNLQVDGNLVVLKPNPSVTGSPLQFEHTDVTGAHVKWTTTIDQCDKPSLAGGVTPCGTSSRLAVVKRGNIEWISLARKTLPDDTLAAIPYWLPANPDFHLLGHIGFNRITGEVAFFGELNGLVYQFDDPETPPGGAGYQDALGRADSRGRYDPNFKIACTACHDNKEPKVLTPYIKNARVGFLDDARRNAFSVGDLLPVGIRRSDEPYRVVGSGFTSGPNQSVINDSQMISSLNTCTNCHDLTTGGTASFAADAINRLADLNPTLSGEVDPARTPWAKRTGDGKIHPWMTVQGNRLANASGVLYAEITSTEQQQLLDALVNPPADAPKVYTPAPAPESVGDDENRIGDPSYAHFVAPVFSSSPDPHPTYDRQLTVRWNYHNSFGGVPTRDDVRFHLAIREVPIPAGGGPSPPADFPTLDQARGALASQIAGNVYRIGDVLVIKDVAFKGHLKWTDPAPTSGPRDYAVAVPAQSGKRYLIRLLSKRFTFDQISAEIDEPGVRYSSYELNVLTVDVN